MKTMTARSVAKSESECTASATMAALWPKMPASSFPDVSTAFTQAPK